MTVTTIKSRSKEGQAKLLITEADAEAGTCDVPSWAQI